MSSEREGLGKRHFIITPHTTVQSHDTVGQHADYMLSEREREGSVERERDICRETIMSVAWKPWLLLVKTKDRERCKRTRVICRETFMKHRLHTSIIGWTWPIPNPRFRRVLSILNSLCLAFWHETCVYVPILDIDFRVWAPLFHLFNYQHKKSCTSQSKKRT
jgi:hypothetical protein